MRTSLQGIKRFRLLLGKAPEIRNDKTLGDVLLKMIREEVIRDQKLSSMHLSM
jgi:hypothetical protein